MKQRGFTIVELSIVLVIIALLFVGILKGQELISRAQAKDVIAIIDDLRAACSLFKQRYHYLPGDWPYAANEIQGVTAGTTKGTNGDGYVDGAISADGAAEAGSEVAELPWQLFSASILGKINTSDPQRRIATSFGAVHVVSRSTADGLVAGFAAANPAARNAVVFYRLPCDIANEVDAKIDDGALSTGRVMGNACANGQMQWFAVAL